MTQQQWGNQPGQAYAPQSPGHPPYGHQPRGGFGQPSFRPGGFQQRGYGGGFQPGGFGGQQGLPQYGPGPVIPQPPRRRSPLRLVLLALSLLAVLAIGSLALAASKGGGSAVAYQNDDYQVPPPDTAPPPIPQARTVSEAREVLTSNELYRQTLPSPVRCLSTPINVATSDDAVMKAHFEGLMECLVRVWQPAVSAAGFQITRPSVTIYGTSMTTKCGTTEVNAFYCTADQQIYYSNQLHEYVRILAEDKWAPDVVMAHEFAHNLQGRTGILFASHALGQMSGDKDVDLEFSRRLEVQADCFSGMFIRSVSLSLGVQQSDVAGIQETYAAVGDELSSGPPNHGRSATRKFWGTTGLGSSDIGRCNTFSVGSDQVR